MKKVGIFLALICNITYGIIVESDHLATILDHLNNPNTLVVFDIDNTLVHPIQELGSDEWFYYSVGKKMAEGFDITTAVNYFMPTAVYTQFNVDVEPTEQEAPELIAYLIDHNIPVMALTARSFFMVERTVEQLHNLNINFFIPTIDSADFIIPTADPCFYKDGMLFTGSNDKGNTLTAFLNIMDLHPKAVIFIDDKMKNIISVEKALQEYHIPCVGIRYSRCDEQVKNFDPAKSDAQWQKLREQKQIHNKK